MTDSNVKINRTSIKNVSKYNNLLMDTLYIKMQIVTSKTKCGECKNIEFLFVFGVVIGIK